MNAPFIPQADLKSLYLAQKDELDAAALRVLGSGWYVLGQEVARFEANFGAFCEVPHAVGVANGTDAVELALRAVGVQAGDRVATVSLTAVATVAAIEHMGAVPVLIDVEKDSPTMCAASLERALQAGPVRAVVPVHLYGQCADMDALLPLAAQHGAVVVEDCAQAHGARLHGRRAGSMGAAAAFSFYPTKNLGAFGDGGAVVTTDTAVVERLHLLRQYGWKARYESACTGINSRLDELQAALLSVRLPRLEQENARRRELAALYGRELAHVPGIELPQGRTDSESVYHLYVIRCADIQTNAHGLLRDSLAASLKKQGIGSAIHYPLAVHQQAAYKDVIACAPGGLPHAEDWCRRILSLPMYPALQDDDVRRVALAVRKWVKGSEPEQGSA